MFNQTALRVVSLLVLLFPATVNAAQRTFVSAGSGSDANPCTRPLPCRSFDTAISQTDSGGEVVVLDSGGYGALTISQSVALIAPPGVHAAISAFSGTAINIDAGSTDVIVLRGLYVNGLGALIGIEMASGEALHVEGCVLSGFEDAGLFADASGADVFVSDTTARQNGYGFYFLSNTSLRASLDSIRAEANSSSGVAAYANSLVTVTRSVAAGNAIAGFHALHDSGVLNLESCTTTMNIYGIRTLAGVTHVRNSMLIGNSSGVFTNAGASTISFGNNGLSGNGTNGSFTAVVSPE